MSDPDAFRTIAGRASAEIPRRKGSRFLAVAAPVEDEETAIQVREELRAQYPDATHHCWGYRLGPDGERYRFSDDGEPSGTAGRPILTEIERRDLLDVLVVVIRHYGGTKLGTGGLFRAYGAAAAAVLEAAEIGERRRRRRLHLRFDYEDTGAAEGVLHRFDTEVVRSRYTEETELWVDVPISRVEAFRRMFTDALGGRGTIEETAGE